MTEKRVRSSSLVVAWAAWIALVVGLVWSPLLSLASQDENSTTVAESCECEEPKCGICEIDSGTTFYTAKCGPKGSRVKSCKKPTCTPVEDQPTCLAEHKASSEGKSPLVSDSTLKDSSGAKSTDRSGRRPSDSSLASDGEVVALTGVATIQRHQSGKSEVLKLGGKVFHGDVVETKKDSMVKIKLFDSEKKSQSSEVTVTPMSLLKLENIQAEEKSAARTITLNLLMGQVRSRVKKKVEGESSFRIRTRTAVAGVRGTDFVTTYRKSGNEWITDVHTLEGSVRLSGIQNNFVRNTEDAAKSQAELEHVEVTSGTYASFVIAAPPRPNDDDEIERMIASTGRFVPVAKMSDEQIRDLDSLTEFADLQASLGSPSAGSRGVASSEALCKEPAGQFNQCSFTCEGNPKGESRCRTDLKGVSCTRRLCRANGKWTDEKRLPASQGVQCAPTKVQVRECGAYW